MGWPETRLGVEFDGRGKYGEDGASAARALFEEKRRQDAIEDEGWTVLRITWRDLTSPAETTTRIHRALHRALRGRRVS